MEKKYLEHTDRFGKTKKFLICEGWSGRVWNVGREQFPFEGWIPLCHCDMNYHVVGELMCFKVDSEELALAAMHAAHYVRCPDYLWFKELRNRFYMDTEQRARWLVGKKVSYVTINQADRLAKTETKGKVYVSSFDSIVGKDVHLYVRHRNELVRLRWSEDFVRQLVLDGEAYEHICEKYYRWYKLENK